MAALSEARLAALAAADIGPLYNTPHGWRSRGNRRFARETVMALLRERLLVRSAIGGHDGARITDAGRAALKPGRRTA